jgi:hypothetical protein
MFGGENVVPIQGDSLKTAMIKPVTTVSGTAAQLSMAAGALFLGLLAALHFIEPAFDPSWRMISEYEIVRFGWVMQLAFFSLAIASLSAIAALWSEVKSIVGSIGLI